MNKTLRRALLAGTALAVPAVINNFIFSRANPIGNPLGGEGRFWPWREGDVFYTKQGQDKPAVVLLHGVYGGASVYEWRRNFDALSEQFTVYAVDLLGFGLSDKPKIRYTDLLYIDLLIDFVKEVVGTPCCVVGSSLCGAYAVEAAVALPDLIDRLVLVCPTGMSRKAEESSAATDELLYQMMVLPIVGTSIYNVISSRGYLRGYLQNQVYFDPSYVTDEMIDHYSTAAHQYGSQYAVQSFVGQQLWHSVAETLPRVDKDILVVWGREAVVSPLSEAERFLAANSKVELKVLDKAGVLPQDEQSGPFNRLVQEFMAGVQAPYADTSNGAAPRRSSRRKQSEPTVGEQTTG